MFSESSKVLETKNGGKGELFFHLSGCRLEGELTRGGGSMGAVEPETRRPGLQGFPWVLFPMWSSHSCIFSSVTEDEGGGILVKQSKGGKGKERGRDTGRWLQF